MNTNVIVNQKLRHGIDFLKKVQLSRKHVRNLAQLEILLAVYLDPGIDNLGIRKITKLTRPGISHSTDHLIDKGYLMADLRFVPRRYYATSLSETFLSTLIKPK